MKKESIARLPGKLMYSQHFSCPLTKAETDQFLLGLIDRDRWTKLDIL
jgi:hypothetical protein